MKAAAIFLIAGRSGLRGRRTLEEGGPYVVVRCNNVVLTWLVRDRRVDPLDEEEDGNEEEEGGGVGGVGEDEEQHGDEGCEESKKFPTANFWGPCHRWIECIARMLSLLGQVRFGSGGPLHPTHRRGAMDGAHGRWRLVDGKTGNDNSKGKCGGSSLRSE
jgi:hypothetical protein